MTNENSALRLEIRNDKQHETSRGIAWSCELWVNGKKAAIAENAGNGGMAKVQWLDPDVKDAVRQHARKNHIEIHTEIVFVADGEGSEWDADYIVALAESRTAETRLKKAATGGAA